MYLSRVEIDINNRQKTKELTILVPTTIGLNKVFLMKSRITSDCDICGGLIVWQGKHTC